MKLTIGMRQTVVITCIMIWSHTYNYDITEHVSSYTIVINIRFKLYNVDISRNFKSLQNCWCFSLIFAIAPRMQFFWVWAFPKNNLIITVVANHVSSILLQSFVVCGWNRTCLFLFILKGKRTVCPLPAESNSGVSRLPTSFLQNTEQVALTWLSSCIRLLLHLGQRRKSIKPGYGALQRLGHRLLYCHLLKDIGNKFLTMLIL